MLLRLAKSLKDQLDKLKKQYKDMEQIQTSIATGKTKPLALVDRVSTQFFVMDSCTCACIPTFILCRPQVNDVLSAFSECTRLDVALNNLVVRARSIP